MSPLKRSKSVSSQPKKRLTEESIVKLVRHNLESIKHETSLGVNVDRDVIATLETALSRLEELNSDVADSELRWALFAPGDPGLSLQP